MNDYINQAQPRNSHTGHLKLVSEVEWRRQFEHGFVGHRILFCYLWPLRLTSFVTLSNTRVTSCPKIAKNARNTNWSNLNNGHKRNRDLRHLSYCDHPLTRSLRRFSKLRQTKMLMKTVVSLVALFTLQGEYLGWTGMHVLNFLTASASVTLVARSSLEILATRQTTVSGCCLSNLLCWPRP